MKSSLRKAMYLLVIVASRIDIFFWKIVNFRKKRILIFTDSRGFEITKWRNRKAPWNSYVGGLKKHYKADIYICPEKHTTIFDFLYVYQSKLQGRKYVAVIVHLGVVDFSPRGALQAQEIITYKEHKIKNVFDNEFYIDLYDVSVYQEEYGGEKTASILKRSSLKAVSEKFIKIPNLIWISCNPVLLGWRGNYRRDRPQNINLVNDFSEEMCEYLSGKEKIDLTKWSADEVKKYTCDNIHLSNHGMELIKKCLNLILDERKF